MRLSNLKIELYWAYVLISCWNKKNRRCLHTVPSSSFLALQPLLCTTAVDCSFLSPPNQLPPVPVINQPFLVMALLMPCLLYMCKNVSAGFCAAFGVYCLPCWILLHCTDSQVTPSGAKLISTNKQCVHFSECWWQNNVYIMVQADMGFWLKLCCQRC